jgi:hypothetical protein
MTSVTALDKAEYMALQESILKSTVGIGIDKNTVIGTGTCVSYGGKNFILTAEHVIRDATSEAIRLFIPPATPLMEHSMRSGLPPNSLGGPIVMGDFFETGLPLVDLDNDIAALPIESTVLFPKHMRFLEMEHVLSQISDGASMLLLGFPVDNSTVLGPNAKLLGLTSEHANYSTTLQQNSHLHSSYDPASHLVVNYTRLDDGIEPFGFSGAGVWCNFNVETQIWEPKPAFAGVVTSWHRNQNLIQITRAQVCQNLFTHINGNSN